MRFSCAAVTRMSQPGRIVFGLLAVAAMVTSLLVSGCPKGQKEPPGAAQAQQESATETPVSVIVAKRGSITEELELTGSCEAYQEVDVVPEISGKVVSVFVDVGDGVTKGQVLARLDTELASKQRVQAEKGVVSAQARYTQAAESSELTDRETQIAIRQAEQGVAAASEQLSKAKQAYELARERSESAIEQAKVGLASAQAQQRDVLAGARSQEITQAEAAVRQAESDLSLKKTTYERYRRLYEQGAVAEATLDQYRTQYEVAQQSLSQARESLSLAREGARQEQKRLAELAVQQAREQLNMAQSGKREVDIAARDVESARVGLRQAEENLRLARASRRRYNVAVADVKAARAGIGQAAAGADLAATTVDKHIIRAPISGRVAQRNIDPGEGASPGMAAMRIVDNDPIRVNCEVSELDISKVRVGDGGVTTVDGLPGLEFFGRVVDVAPQAREGRRSYIARVEIDNPEGLIRAGMFARVVLVISEKQDVIVVSRDCLVERGARKNAYVVKNGVVEIRKVKVGITNRDLVEVVSGLQAGDQVVCASQSILAAGQKVKAVPKSSGKTTPSSQSAQDGGAAEGTPGPQSGAGTNARDGGREAMIGPMPAAEGNKPRSPGSTPRGRSGERGAR